jgi:hypothetical protein
MNQQLRKVQAIAMTVLLSLASMIGIPLKGYIKHVHDELEKSPTYIQIKTPIYWTAYMSKTYARGFIAMEYPSWGRAEWKALSKLWGKESAWNHLADNPKSSAYGIAQVLNTKPGTPAPLQIERGLAYIDHRYGKPSIAWSHWRKHGWY